MADKNSDRNLRSIAARIRALPEAERVKLLTSLKPGDAYMLDRYWPLWSMRGQRAPDGQWRIWLIRAGRGFGKTRAGAEWVSEIARNDPDARIALVGGTAADVRRVMVEGESGLLAVARDQEAPRWHATNGVVEFDSGAKAYAFSAAAPEKLRGPQHHAAWCDELAKWRDGTKAWDNLLLGLRLGDEAPEPGQCWIVGDAPIGIWAGRANAIAAWTAGGWRFIPPVQGMAAWVESSGLTARYLGGAWSIGSLAATRIVIAGEQVVGARSAAIPEPAGGDVVDAESRATLAAILAMLRTHGLIDG